MEKSYKVIDKLTKNKKFVTNLINNYKKRVSKPDVNINQTHESCINLCKGMLVLIENTDFKQDLINGYNARLKSSITNGRDKISEIMDINEYYDIKKSDEYKYVKYVFKKNEDGTLSYKDKAEQMLKQNNNKDVVIEGFRKAISPDKKGKYNFEFSKIYCADLLNRLSHHIISHQKAIRKTIYFKDKPLNSLEFEKKLTAIKTLKESSDQNYFETSNVSSYLQDVEKNVENPKYKEDYDTFSRILKTVFPTQTINKKFISSMNECYNDRELIDLFFEGKSLAIGDLWISQNKIKKSFELKDKDPYEENALSYRTDLISDERITPKGEKTCRVCMCLQSEYEDLIRSNNGFVYAPNYNEYLATKYNVTLNEIEECLEKTSKKLKMPIVKDYEDNAIKDQANMTVFHLTQDFIDRYKGKYDLDFLKETESAYLKRTAFRSSNFLTPYSKRKSTNKIDLHILSDVSFNCMDVEEKYDDDYEKINKVFDIEKYVTKELNSRGKGEI